MIAAVLLIFDKGNLICLSCFFADIPIAEVKLDDWIALIYDNPKGFALTRTMPGFISAETAIMTDENGQASFLLWEKWEKQEDFAHYNQQPDRLEDSEFMQQFFACVGGAPKMGFVRQMSM